MGTMVVAYLVCWAATSAYVGWMAVQNARLAERQRALQKILDERDCAGEFYSKAA